MLSYIVLMAVITSLFSATDNVLAKKTGYGSPCNSYGAFESYVDNSGVGISGATSTMDVLGSIISTDINSGLKSDIVNSLASYGKAFWRGTIHTWEEVESHHVLGSHDIACATGTGSSGWTEENIGKRYGKLIAADTASYLGIPESDVNYFQFQEKKLWLSVAYFEDGCTEACLSVVGHDNTDFDGDTNYGQSYFSSRRLGNIPQASLLSEIQNVFKENTKLPGKLSGSGTLYIRYREDGKPEKHVNGTHDTAVSSNIEASYSAIYQSGELLGEQNANENFEYLASYYKWKDGCITVVITAKEKTVDIDYNAPYNKDNPTEKYENGKALELSKETDKVKNNKDKNAVKLSAVVREKSTVNGNLKNTDLEMTFEIVDESESSSSAYYELKTPRGASYRTALYGVEVMAGTTGSSYANYKADFKTKANIDSQAVQIKFDSKKKNYSSDKLPEGVYYDEITKDMINPGSAFTYTAEAQYANDYFKYVMNEVVTLVPWEDKNKVPTVWGNAAVHPDVDVDSKDSKLASLGLTIKDKNTIFVPKGVGSGVQLRENLNETYKGVFYDSADGGSGVIDKIENDRKVDEIANTLYAEAAKSSYTSKATQLWYLLLTSNSGNIGRNIDRAMFGEYSPTIANMAEDKLDDAAYMKAAYVQTDIYLALYNLVCDNYKKVYGYSYEEARKMTVVKNIEKAVKSILQVEVNRGNSKNKGSDEYAVNGKTGHQANMMIERAVAVNFNTYEQKSEGGAKKDEHIASIVFNVHDYINSLMRSHTVKTSNIGKDKVVVHTNFTYGTKNTDNGEYYNMKVKRKSKSVKTVKTMEAFKLVSHWTSKLYHNRFFEGSLTNSPDDLSVSLKDELFYTLKNVVTPEANKMKKNGTYNGIADVGSNKWQFVASPWTTKQTFKAIMGTNNGVEYKADGDKPLITITKNTVESLDILDSIKDRRTKNYRVQSYYNWKVANTYASKKINEKTNSLDAVPVRVYGVIGIDRSNNLALSDYKYQFATHTGYKTVEGYVTAAKKKYKANNPPAAQIILNKEKATQGDHSDDTVQYIAPRLYGGTSLAVQSVDCNGVGIKISIQALSKNLKEELRDYNRINEKVNGQKRYSYVATTLVARTCLCDKTLKKDDQNRVAAIADGGRTIYTMVAYETNKDITNKVENFLKTDGASEGLELNYYLDSTSSTSADFKDAKLRTNCDQSIDKLRTYASGLTYVYRTYYIIQLHDKLGEEDDVLIASNLGTKKAKDYMVGLATKEAKKNNKDSKRWATDEKMAEKGESKKILDKLWTSDTWDVNKEEGNGSQAAKVQPITLKTQAEGYNAATGDKGSGLYAELKIDAGTGTTYGTYKQDIKTVFDVIPKNDDAKKQLTNKDKKDGITWLSTKSVNDGLVNIINNDGNFTKRMKIDKAGNKYMGVDADVKLVFDTSVKDSNATTSEDESWYKCFQQVSKGKRIGRIDIDEGGNNQVYSLDEKLKEWNEMVQKKSGGKDKIDTKVYKQITIQLSIKSKYKSNNTGSKSKVMRVKGLDNGKVENVLASATKEADETSTFYSLSGETKTGDGKRVGDISNGKNIYMAAHYQPSVGYLLWGATASNITQHMELSVNVSPKFWEHLKDKLEAGDSKVVSVSLKELFATKAAGRKDQYLAKRIAKRPTYNDAKKKDKAGYKKLGNYDNAGFNENLKHVRQSAAYDAFMISKAGNGKQSLLTTGTWNFKMAIGDIYWKASINASNKNASKSHVKEVKKLQDSGVWELRKPGDWVSVTYTALVQTKVGLHTNIASTKKIVSPDVTLKWVAEATPPPSKKYKIIKVFSDSSECAEGTDKDNAFILKAGEETYTYCNAENSPHAAIGTDDTSGTQQYSGWEFGYGQEHSSGEVKIHSTINVNDIEKITKFGEKEYRLVPTYRVYELEPGHKDAEGNDLDKENDWLKNRELRAARPIANKITGEDDKETSLSIEVDQDILIVLYYERMGAVGSEIQLLAKAAFDMSSIGSKGSPYSKALIGENPEATKQNIINAIKGDKNVWQKDMPANLIGEYIRTGDKLTDFKPEMPIEIKKDKPNTSASHKFETSEENELKFSELPSSEKKEGKSPFIGYTESGTSFENFGIYTNGILFQKELEGAKNLKRSKAKDQVISDTKSASVEDYTTLTNTDATYTATEKGDTDESGTVEVGRIVVNLANGTPLVVVVRHRIPQFITDSYNVEYNVRYDADDQMIITGLSSGAFTNSNSSIPKWSKARSALVPAMGTNVYYSPFGESCGGESTPISNKSTLAGYCYVDYRANDSTFSSALNSKLRTDLEALSDTFDLSVGSYKAHYVPCDDLSVVKIPADDQDYKIVPIYAVNPPAKKKKVIFKIIVSDSDNKNEIVEEECDVYTVISTLLPSDDTFTTTFNELTQVGKDKITSKYGTGTKADKDGKVSEIMKYIEESPIYNYENEDPTGGIAEKGTVYTDYLWKADTDGNPSYYIDKGQNVISDITLNSDADTTYTLYYVRNIIQGEIAEDPGKTYSEVKYGKTSEENEKYAVMAGVPTTETLHFKAGGSEFLLAANFVYDKEAKAYRKYQSYYSSGICEYHQFDKLHKIKSSDGQFEQEKEDTLQDYEGDGEKEQPASYKGTAVFKSRDREVEIDGKSEAGGSQGDVGTYNSHIWQSKVDYNNDTYETRTERTLTEKGKVKDKGDDVKSADSKMIVPRKPEKGSSLKYWGDIQHDKDNLIFAEWTGSIANDSEDPKVGDDMGAGPKADVKKEDNAPDTTCGWYSGNPGNMNEGFSKTNWNEDNVNGFLEALDDAKAWATAMEKTSDTYTIRNMSDSDDKTRVFCVGDAMITIEIEGIDDADGGHNMRHRNAGNDQGSDGDVHGSKGPSCGTMVSDFKRSNFNATTEEFNSADSLQDGNFGGQLWKDMKKSLNLDYHTPGDLEKLDLQGDFEKVYNFLHSNLGDHDKNTRSFGYGFREEYGVPMNWTGKDTESYSCIYSGNPPAHSGHTWNGWSSRSMSQTVAYKETTTSQASGLTYKIRVAFKNGYTAGKTNNGETVNEEKGFPRHDSKDKVNNIEGCFGGSKESNDSYYHGSKKDDGNKPNEVYLPAHALCGPCCSHVLPMIQDTWTQQTTFNTVRMKELHIWRIDGTYLRGITDGAEADDPDNEMLLQCSENLLIHDNIAANIGPNIFFNIAKSNTSMEGRLRYSYQPEKHDQVTWYEGSRANNRCDGQEYTDGDANKSCKIWSPKYNPYDDTMYIKKDAGDGVEQWYRKYGHDIAWAHGCLYNNNDYIQEANTVMDSLLDSGVLYSYNTLCDYITMDTPEAKRFAERRSTVVHATVISDFLILQTTSGDQSVMYYQSESSSNRADSPLFESSSYDDLFGRNDLWYNNSMPNNVNIGGYNGLYSSKTKTMGTGFLTYNDGLMGTKLGDNKYKTVECGSGDYKHYAWKFNSFKANDEKNHKAGDGNHKLNYGSIGVNKKYGMTLYKHIVETIFDDDPAYKAHKENGSNKDEMGNALGAEQLAGGSYSDYMETQNTVNNNVDKYSSPGSAGDKPRQARLPRPDHELRLELGNLDICRTVRNGEIDTGKGIIFYEKLYNYNAKYDTALKQLVSADGLEGSSEVDLTDIYTSDKDADLPAGDGDTTNDSGFSSSSASSSIDDSGADYGDIKDEDSDVPPFHNALDVAGIAGKEMTNPDGIEFEQAAMEVNEVIRKNLTSNIYNKVGWALVTDYSRDQNTYTGSYGYKKYGPNNVIIDNPVVIKAAVVDLVNYDADGNIIKGDTAADRDQRTEEGVAKKYTEDMKDEAQCPGDPGLCDFRVLNCKFYDDSLLDNFDFDIVEDGKVTGGVTGKEYDVDGTGISGGKLVAKNSTSAFNICLSDIEGEYTRQNKLKIQFNAKFDTSLTEYSLISFNKLYLGTYKDGGQTKFGFKTSYEQNDTVATQEIEDTKEIYYRDSSGNKRSLIDLFNSSGGETYSFTVTVSMSDLKGCTLAVTNSAGKAINIIGEEKVIAHNIREDSIGDNLLIGDRIAGGSITYDNLEVYKAAGSRSHTEACYDVTRIHAKGKIYDTKAVPAMEVVSDVVLKGIKTFTVPADGSYTIKLNNTNGHNVTARLVDNSRYANLRQPIKSGYTYRLEMGDIIELDGDLPNFTEGTSGEELDADGNRVSIADDVTYDEEDDENISMWYSYKRLHVYTEDDPTVDNPNSLNAHEHDGECIPSYKSTGNDKDDKNNNAATTNMISRIVEELYDNREEPFRKYVGDKVADRLIDTGLKDLVIGDFSKFPVTRSGLYAVKDKDNATISVSGKTAVIGILGENPSFNLVANIEGRAVTKVKINYKFTGTDTKSGVAAMYWDTGSGFNNNNVIKKDASTSSTSLVFDTSKHANWKKNIKKLKFSLLDEVNSGQIILQSITFTYRGKYTEPESKVNTINFINESQIKKADSGSRDYTSATSGVQTFTAPATATYKFKVKGVGNDTATEVSYDLVKDEVVSVYVGSESYYGGVAEVKKSDGTTIAKSNPDYGAEYINRTTTITEADTQVHTFEVTRAGTLVFESLDAATGRDPKGKIDILRGGVLIPGVYDDDSGVGLNFRATANVQPGDIVTLYVTQYSDASHGASISWQTRLQGGADSGTSTSYSAASVNISWSKVDYDLAKLQEYTAVATGNYRITLYGASGGPANGKQGDGAVVEAFTSLNAGDKIYLGIGGQGAANKGGLNGGGSGYKGGYGGGGMTYATKANTISVDANGVVFGNKLIAVAAGGGGYANNTKGGNAGLYDASVSPSSLGQVGRYANGNLLSIAAARTFSNGTGSGYLKGLAQSAPETSGTGATGGGGAGYYGGNAGLAGFTGTSGSGGSSYVNTTIAESELTGEYNNGNGKAIIEYTKPLTITYKAPISIMDGTAGTYDNVINMVRDNIIDIPTKLGNSINPVFTCGNIPNRHVCTKECGYSVVLNCDERHHEGKHYGEDSDICYDACNDSSNHVKNILGVSSKDKDGNTVKHEPAYLLTLDHDFGIFWSNRGDFHQTNSTSEDLGNTQQWRGEGYVDNMDTTQWIREKKVKFPFNVLYYRVPFDIYTGTYDVSKAGWEQYKANEWINVELRGVTNDGMTPIKDKVTFDTSEEETCYYKFYCTLSNSEMAAADIEFADETINCPNGNDKLNRYKPYDNNYRYNVDNTEDYRNWTEYDLNPTWKTVYSAMHSCTLHIYEDIVGRIGNLMGSDTEDIRYSNLFKWSIDNDNDGINDEEQYIANLLDSVDVASQRSYFMASNTDIRNRDTTKKIARPRSDVNSAVQKVYWRFNTWGTQPWNSDEVIEDIQAELYDKARGEGKELEYGKAAEINPKELPVSADKNDTIEGSLKEEEMKIGYDLIWEISTMGEYYDKDATLQIIPYYYAFNKKTREIIPVDAYQLTKGVYEPVNYYDAVGNEGKNDDSKWSVLEGKLADTLLNVDWVKEEERRNADNEREWSAEIAEAYATFDREFQDGINGAVDEDLKDVTYLKVPEGHYNKIGSCQLLTAGADVRTFIGESTTIGEVFSYYEPATKSKVETNDTNYRKELHSTSYGIEAQRWHLRTGLPSSAVLVPVESLGQNADGSREYKRVLPTDIVNKNDFRKPVDSAENAVDAKDYFKSEDGWVILMTGDIRIEGKVWTLKYKNDKDFRRIQLTGMESPVYFPDGTIPTLLAVYSCDEQAKVDVDTINTH